MGDKLWFILPEILLFIGVVVVAVMGSSKSRGVRDSIPMMTGAFLALTMIITPFLYRGDRIEEAGLIMPLLGMYIKPLVAGIGLILVMLTVGLIDRRYEGAIEGGRVKFDPIRSNRGEFYAFFLLSLIGVMLCCNANDLIWLFLALELTSLPTYIMVAMSREQKLAQEAAVKYFFLGALAAALFLYGFALLYGATGTIVLSEMAEVFAAQRIVNGGAISTLGTLGMILAILGIGFKLAAAPLHFYAADVYEGAASPITAFLGFVPKAAGIVALLLILSTVGWSIEVAGVQALPQPILATLWIIAVLTMTLGNIAALLQKSAKRMLAYSSIAHSGYLLIGVIAGPEFGGLDAVLFYLFAYGVMNTAAFAVLSGLERRGHEVESLSDLAGLRQRHPWMAVVLALAAASLLGFPPLLGFFGKLALFMAGINAGHVLLIVIAALNSAISAFYYLALVKVSILDDPNAQSETVVKRREVWPRFAAGLAAVVILLGWLPLLTGPMLEAAESAVHRTPPVVVTADQDRLLAP